MDKKTRGLSGWVNLHSMLCGNITAADNSINDLNTRLACYSDLDCQQIFIFRSNAPTLVQIQWTVEATRALTSAATATTIPSATCSSIFGFRFVNIHHRHKRNALFRSRGSAKNWRKFSCPAHIPTWKNVTNKFLTMFAQCLAIGNKQSHSTSK